MQQPLPNDPAEIRGMIAQVQGQIDNQYATEPMKVQMRAFIANLEAHLHTLIHKPTSPPPPQAPRAARPPATHTKPPQPAPPAEKRDWREAEEARERHATRKATERDVAAGGYRLAGSAPRAEAPPTGPMPTVTYSTTEASTVTIDWNTEPPPGDGRYAQLTEAECRSRFTTALRDLAESKLARQDRYEHMLREYVTFRRAVAYFSALEIFWGRALDARTLNLHGMGKERTRVFDEILKHAHGDAGKL